MLCWKISYSQSIKTYETIKVNNSLIIDGLLTENEWDQVSWADGFIQNDPDNGELPSFETQFKILYDQEYLYVAIQAFDEQPDSIVVIDSPRDFFAGDYVEINIDSDNDEIDAFSFTITAAGIRGDEHIKTSDNWYNDWNPEWSAKTTIGKNGWIAEMRIPINELDAYKELSHWGLEVNRYIERYDELSSWTHVPDEDRWVEYFGHLTGIKSISVLNVPAKDHKIESELLKQDFNFLYQTLITSYPSLYRYQSQNTIEEFYQSSLNSLENNLNIVEYYRVICSFLGLIGDGHMKIELPRYFQNQLIENLGHFPFKWSFAERRAFIYQNNSKVEEISNAEIISINGKPISEISDEIIEVIPSDGFNTTGKYYRLSKNFDFYYSLFYPSEEQIEIEYIPLGQTQTSTSTISLLSEDAYESLFNNSYPESFEFEISGDIGIFKIRTFGDSYGYEEFIDESFKEIASLKVNKLILDLRDNGGGEEKNAIYLYSYLAEEEFTYYDRYEVNATYSDSTLVSHETVNYLSKMTSEDSKGRSIFTPQGLLEDRFIDPSKKISPSSQYNYTGDVIVLINGGSFSATSELCTIIRKHNRAVFIGSETGGAFDGNTSGIFDLTTLPNSRIRINIPLVKYVNSIENVDYEYGMGIIPDHTINEFKIIQKNQNEDLLLQYGVDLLNSKE